MKYYPLFLDIRHRNVLVIGGGNIALEKIINLLKAGATLTVIAPDILPSIRRFNRRITVIERHFELEDICEDYYLVFAATGESALNATVSSVCRDRRILCNTVDEPAHCHFIVPAIVRRGAITIAISTSGVSPFLARTLKEQLRDVIGPEYTTLTRLLNSYRRSIKSKFNTFQERVSFWSIFFRYNPAMLIRTGHITLIKQAIDSALSNSEK